VVAGAVSVRAWAVVALAAIAVVAAGCHGSGSSKAGGSERGSSKPLTLTLFTGDGTFAPEYAAAVERLSGGAMRIEITVAGNSPAYEQRTVEYVRAGKADLGSVGARVWDVFGVTTFQALLAPLLVDGLPFEGRVLASPLAAEMLAGLDRARVVGLAVLPGPLRRPLGLSRTLLGPRDYDGARIAIRYGGVARATLRALGATAVGYNVGVLPHVDGAELDSNTIAENGFDRQARALTANVVLWPRPQTIFMNRRAYERLTTAQRAILRSAGRAALAPELARVQQDEANGLSTICDRGALSLPAASRSQLAALGAAVRPVYAELARDPTSRRLMAAIRRLRRGTATDVARCPGSAAATAASRLAGLWRVTTSRSDLLSAGARPSEAERQRGRATLSLGHGRWVGRERHTGFVWRGTYSVRGNVLRLVMTVCPPTTACAPGETNEFAWSSYRDRLSLHLLSGGVPSYVGLIAKPLTRAR
jgi:TRAP-type C4-dicarboxylate transport system substrate-binding protein